MSSRQIISLNGDDWRLSAFDEWRGTLDIPATVPGDVHGDLERAGRISDIHIGLNSREVRDVPCRLCQVVIRGFTFPGRYCKTPAEPQFPHERISVCLNR
jgi:hypothetical protein